jgi:putative Holliday junction resolvase
MNQESAMPEPSSDEFPRDGVLFGIDFGTKRVGVSVSDMYQKYASPLENYARQSLIADAKFFRRLAEDFRPVGLVVGLPIHLSGDESEKSTQAREYAAWLSATLSLPVAFQDERFSSVQAEMLLIQAEMTKKQRQARLDKLAAQVLLQAFLDARSPATSGMPSESPTSNTTQE